MGDRYHPGGQRHHNHQNQHYQHHHHPCKLHHQQHHRNTGPKHGNMVVCYYGAWAVYRDPPAKFTVEDIDPTICTHLIYSFAAIDANTHCITSKDPWEDLEDGGGKGGYKRAVALKARNPNLKVSIAVGGWNERAEKFSNMAASPMSRAQFIKSVLTFLNTYKFDGLDLDWEYPGYAPQGGRPQDKINFVALVKELKEAFKPRNYILTAAFAYGKDKLEAGYDLPKLNSYLDFVHVMSYDYHGAWDNVVGANAPLKSSGSGDFLNVEHTIKYLLSRGISQTKLVLGVPFYGRTYLLQNPSSGSVEFGRTPTKGGFPGPLIKENNFMGYNEICWELSNNSSNWMCLWDDKSSTPYLRSGEKIVSYDNTKSIGMKVKMAKDFCLAGIMVWSIETDDFSGISKNERYPNYKLLRTINQELKKVEASNIAVAQSQQPIKKDAPKTTGSTFSRPHLPKKIEPTKSTWPGAVGGGSPTSSGPSKNTGSTTKPQSAHTGKYTGIRKQ